MPVFLLGPVFALHYFIPELSRNAVLRDRSRYKALQPRSTV